MIEWTLVLAAVLAGLIGLGALGRGMMRRRARARAQPPSDIYPMW